MDIDLYYNASENNKVSKSLTLLASLQGTLRDDCDLLNPIIMIEMSAVPNANYAHIPLFNRYYYISDITNFRNNLWIMRLNVDVLYTYRNQIMNIPAILQETESFGSDVYLSDTRVWINKVKDKTDILSFPSGLSETGHFILITAGG